MHTYIHTYGVHSSNAIPHAYAALTKGIYILGRFILQLARMIPEDEDNEEEWSPFDLHFKFFD
jgi:hypothetical protein